jgi:hypothetical protein
MYICLRRPLMCVLRRLFDLRLVGRESMKKCPLTTMDNVCRPLALKKKIIFINLIIQFSIDDDLSTVSDESVVEMNVIIYFIIRNANKLKTNDVVD